MALLECKLIRAKALNYDVYLLENGVMVEAEWFRPGQLGVVRLICANVLRNEVTTFQKNKKTPDI